LNTVFNVNAIKRRKFPKQRLLVLDIIVCILGHSKTKAAIKFLFLVNFGEERQTSKSRAFAWLAARWRGKKSVASVH
jgi:hypothetical protein